MVALGPARKNLFQAADLLPWVVGATFVWLGLPGRPLLVLAGAVVVGVAGLMHLAAASGFAVPRPGRVRIIAQGCWDIPLAFFVCRRGHSYLFYRTFDATTGLFPETYCVIALPSECDEESIKRRGFEPPCGSRLLGAVSTHDLRFEHRGGDSVDEASLATVLARLAA